MNSFFGLEALSRQFGEQCVASGIKVVTAESCTAGLIGSTIAMTPGSSAWLDRGFIVYTADAKHEMLGVSHATIKDFDITSVQVAKEMAVGALNRSKANLALAVTGLAGPAGGTDAIPVGTVCMAWAFKGEHAPIVTLQSLVFTGSRNQIREAVVRHMLINALNA